MDESKTLEVVKKEKLEAAKNVKEDNSRTKTNIVGEKMEKLGDEHVIDMKLKKDGESSTTEKVCRICHLSTEYLTGNLELIQLGCDCKADLGLSHRYCGESWFIQRGNRFCEICGKTARNITGIEQQEVRAAAIEWNNGATITLTTNSYPLPEETAHRCKHCFCNILLVCFIIAFTLPWFFRINISK